MATYVSCPIVHARQLMPGGSLDETMQVWESLNSMQNMMMCFFSIWLILKGLVINLSHHLLENGQDHFFRLSKLN